jgi:hypothetical protein
MVVSKRFLSLPGESLVGAGEVVIELKQGVIGSFALELALLLSGLVQSLRIQPSKGPQLLVTLTDGERVSKANMTPEPPDTVRLKIGRNQAAYLQAALLRAYRDQMAEVDHVHIEGQCNGTPFDLTVMFEFARVPMTPEEAQKLMSL